MYWGYNGRKCTNLSVPGEVASRIELREQFIHPKDGRAGFVTSVNAGLTSLVQIKNYEA